MVTVNPCIGYNSCVSVFQAVSADASVNTKLVVLGILQEKVSIDSRQHG